MQDQSTKRIGRPPLQPEQRRTERFEMRTFRDLKAKILRNGGAQWVESLVRKAPDKA